MSIKRESKHLQEDFLQIVKDYLDDSKPIILKELEIRFGTRNIVRV